MNTGINALLTVVLTLGMLASCAQPNPHPMVMSVAIHNAP